ncbi:MAG: hypothetical protein K2Q18_19085 [Bdellovibrionales bacterium]|nr:hypothetical protein [Bdellovibrionales bacterium]
MSLKRPFYFCCECKKILADLDDLLFIDETSSKGFCSEDCIEDFHFPIIKYYEVLEAAYRSKYGLQDEGIVDPKLIDQTIESPSEVYKMTNELNDTFYHFIKAFPGFSVIVVTSIYRKEASFVFLSLTSKSSELIEEFRFGEKVLGFGDDLLEQVLGSDASAYEIESESASEYSEAETEEGMIFIQLLESKKSKLLADILMLRQESDIPFEDYSGYESCFQETLDFPDEVFEKKDNEGDIIFSYIKSFSNLTYIVACLKRDDGQDNVSVYPILGLPTTDMKMCQEFRGGIRLSGPLKN